MPAPPALVKESPFCAGHECVETVTDPGVNTWMDVYGAENGDKCTSWGYNLDLPIGTFPVQPSWSSYQRYTTGGGCRYTM